MARGSSGHVASCPDDSTSARAPTNCALALVSVGVASSEVFHLPDLAYNAGDEYKALTLHAAEERHSQAHPRRTAPGRKFSLILRQNIVDNFTQVL